MLNSLCLVKFVDADLAYLWSHYLVTVNPGLEI